MTLKHAVEDFFARHAPEDVDLVLDSTGPSLTKHYLALDAIGSDRLARFKRVHTFSGGTFAYFGYLAASRGRCRHPLSVYYKDLDRQMRRAHGDLVPVLQPLARYLRTKSFYQSTAPMERVIRYVFDDKTLATPLADVAPNFSAYHATARGIARCDGGKPHAELATVFDVIRSAVNIPFLYKPDGRPSDPAFHRDYRRTLKAIPGPDGAALVVTPWKSGVKGKTLFLNPFAPKNQKLVMGRDILCLLLNVPNQTYGRDLEAIFG